MLERYRPLPPTLPEGSERGKPEGCPGETPWARDDRGRGGGRRSSGSSLGAGRGPPICRAAEMEKVEDSCVQPLETASAYQRAGAVSRDHCHVVGSPEGESPSTSEGYHPARLAGRCSLWNERAKQQPPSLAGAASDCITCACWESVYRSPVDTIEGQPLRRSLETEGRGGVLNHVGEYGLGGGTLDPPATGGDSRKQ